MKGLNISLVALMAAYALPAQAQDIELDEIVITANLSKTERAKAGASVTSLGSAAMTGAQGGRGTAMLERIPGVSVRTLGPVGTQAGLTIRGVPHTNVVVLVDGIDVTDPSGTQVTYDFGRLSVMDVQRLEVARGAQSALYGSRAVGGVIDMTTRRATEEGLTQEASAEFGSFKTAALSYGLAVKKGVSDLALTLSHIETEGFSAADKALGFTEPDGYNADRVSFSAGTELPGGLRLTVNGFYDDSIAEYDEAVGGIPLDGTPDEIEARTQKALRVAAAFSTGGLDHQLELAYFDSDRVLTGTNGFGAFRFNFRGTRETLGYRGKADIAGFGVATLGVERVQETYFDDTGFGSQTLTTDIGSVYGELAMAPTGDVDMVVSARLDDHSRFGKFATGRASLNWRFADSMTLRANVGNAYRAPSNYELFDVYSGNPNLQAETSKTFDLGIERSFGEGRTIAATVFAVKAEDLIDYSYTTYAYVQAPGSVTRKGLEIEGSWAFSNGLSVNGSYTYTASKSSVALDSSAWLASTPRHQLALSGGADFGSDWHGDIGINHAAGRVGLDDYTVVNMGLTKSLGAGREAYIRVENLFDEQYQTVPGYGTAGRAAFVGLRATF